LAIRGTRIVLDTERPERIHLRYYVSDDLKRRAAFARKLLIDRLSGFRIMRLRPDLMMDFGHPSGACRFGCDPATSVLDLNCRAHEIENLYVVDGSFMPSSSGTNPALTIAANALRVGDVVSLTLRDN
jgi:choline dehydrogenase-like flavoprotein